MNYFILKLVLIGSLLSTIVACSAGNYDLTPCGDRELCGNGIDDDCDGIKDNAEICACTTMGDFRKCPPRTGIVTNSTNPTSICTDGNQTCRADRQWSDCDEVGPILEQCGNDSDDDCDGSVDAQDPEGCIPCVDGQIQYLATPGLSYRDESVCKIGIQDCQRGTWVTRPGFERVGPKTIDDNCDFLDDDCDGQVDEDAKLGTLPMGAVCFNSAVEGACRTTGTVACNSAGAAICNTAMPLTDDVFHKTRSPNVYTDSSTPDAAWDWNCNGITESIFATGSVATRTGSNISKTIYISLGGTMDCTMVRHLTLPLCSAVVISASTPGAFIQCGSPVTVTDCAVDPDLEPFNCRNSSTQNGFLYCK